MYHQKIEKSEEKAPKEKMKREGKGFERCDERAC